METLQSVLFVIQIIICVFLVLLILVQKSGEDALSGIGGSAGNKSFITQKTAADIVTKLTMTLIILFMLNCLSLAVISSRMSNKNQMMIDKYTIEQETSDNYKKTLEIPDSK